MNSEAWHADLDRAVELSRRMLAGIQVNVRPSVIAVEELARITIRIAETYGESAEGVCGNCGEEVAFEGHDRDGCHRAK